jgi:XXXCH domain-containing protein
MGRSEIKHETTTSWEEVGHLLSRLGEEVRAGRVTWDDTELDLAHVQKMKISLKSPGDAVDLELRLKLAKKHGPGFHRASGDAGLIKYKTLKKRMKHDFRAIRAGLDEGLFASDEVLERFFSDCELMCTFPGRGDAHYPAFLEGVGELRTASRERDVARALEAVRKVDQLRSESHDRYK